MLGEQIGVDTLPIVAGQDARRDRQARARARGALGGYDVLILDTAGRTHIDEELMAETAEIKARRQSARNPARRRCADRPGRGQSRALLR